MHKHTDEKLLLRVETLGCKLNFAESSALARTLRDFGYEQASDDDMPDVVIINTCTVTDTADKKGRQLIRAVVRKYPNAFVVVTGCYAQLKPSEIGKIEGVDLVLGANEKVVMEEFMQNVAEKRGRAFTVPLKEIVNFKPECSAEHRTRHFLKVQDGCDYYCTYCTIPFARGRSRSATVAQTLQPALEAIEQGAKEIVITGVNTGDFGRHNGETFLQLLQALDSVEAEVRFRVSSIEPNLLSDDIIQFIAESNRFTPHFHIPLQSGSDEVLRLMHRRYDTQLFRSKIDSIRRFLPNAFIGVDLMTGCRGETQEEYEKSKAFVQSLDITRLHVFTYSERAGTRAIEILPIVPIQERRKRTEEMMRISLSKLEAFYRANIGEQSRVLWEETSSGVMHGFTDNYIRLQTQRDDSKINKFETLLVTEQNILIDNN